MTRRSTPLRGAWWTWLLPPTRAAHLGRNRFLTFDVDAARLPGVELLA